MKNTKKLIIILSLAIWLPAIALAQNCLSVDATDDCIQIITKKVEGYENLVQFDVIGLPAVKCKCSERFANQNFFKYFWRFGDDKGGYAIDIKNPTYQYTTAGNYDVTLEVTRIKVDVDEDEDDEGVIDTGGNNGSGREKRILVDEKNLTVQQPNANNTNWSYRHANPTRDVPQDKVALNYSRPPIVNSSDPNSQKQYFTVVTGYNNWNDADRGFFFRYPDEYLTIKDTYPPHNNTGTLYESKYISWASSQSINPEFLVTDSPQNYFITFEVKPDVAKGTKLDLSHFLINLNNSTAYDASFKDIQTAILRSYDPNIKTVNYDYISGQTNLSYTIEFQNEGCGETDSIKVIDRFSDVLDMSTFVLDSIEIGGDIYHTPTQPNSNFTMSTDTDERTVTFLMESAFLQGLRGLENPNDCDENAELTGAFDCAAEWTIGHIYYSIDTKDFVEELPNNNQIEVWNHTIFGTPAQVFFDDNEVISTEAAHTQVDYPQEMCPTNITLDITNSTSTNADNILNVETSNNITASNIISDQTAATYSGTNITVVDGFLGEEGSDVLMRVQPCTSGGNNSGKIQNYREDIPIQSILTNYPNPIIDHTYIHFNLAKKEKISLNITDINGKIIETLINGKVTNAGQNKILFKPQNLPPGTYFCNLLTTKENHSNKMIVITE